MDIDKDVAISVVETIYINTMEDRYDVKDLFPKVWEKFPFECKKEILVEATKKKILVEETDKFKEYLDPNSDNRIIL